MLQVFQRCLIKDPLQAFYQCDGKCLNFLLGFQSRISRIILAFLFLLGSIFLFGCLCMGKIIASHVGQGNLISLWDTAVYIWLLITLEITGSVNPPLSGCKYKSRQCPIWPLQTWHPKFPSWIWLPAWASFLGWLRV